MTKKWITVFLVLISLPLFAQYSSELRNSRPGRSMGSFTVGKNILIVQHYLRAGIKSNRESALLDPAAYNPVRVIVQENGFRFGLTERIEGNFVYNLNTEWRRQADNPDAPVSQRQIQSVGLAARFNLLDPTFKSPGILLLTRAWYRASEDGSTIHPDFMVAIVQPLPNNYQFFLNVGVQGDRFQELKYTFQARKNLSNRWAVFAEYYGFRRQLERTVFIHYFDTGVGWVLSPGFKLDIAVAYGNNLQLNPRHEFFAEIGVSWRLRERK